MASNKWSKEICGLKFGFKILNQTLYIYSPVYMKRGLLCDFHNIEPNRIGKKKSGDTVRYSFSGLIQFRTKEFAEELATSIALMHTMDIQETGTDDWAAFKAKFRQLAKRKIRQQ